MHCVAGFGWQWQQNKSKTKEGIVKRKINFQIIFFVTQPVTSSTNSRSPSSRVPALIQPVSRPTTRTICIFCLSVPEMVIECPPTHHSTKKGRRQHFSLFLQYEWMIDLWTSELATEWCRHGVDRFHDSSSCILCCKEFYSLLNFDFVENMRAVTVCVRFDRRWHDETFDPVTTITLVTVKTVRTRHHVKRGEIELIPREPTRLFLRTLLI